MSEMKEMRSVAEVMAGSPVDCVSVLYSLLMLMPDEYVIPTICTALDQWFADRDFTEEQALDTYKLMAKTAEACYKDMGMCPKSSYIKENE